MARSPKLTTWLVYISAVLSYLVAVAHRSSLAALGVTTQERFEIDSTTLAMFAVLQMLVYAAMQIPVGVLIDRVGPSAMIISGLVMMNVAQTAMALSENLPLIIAARVLLGAGDATIFMSMVRILVNWFPAKMIPTLSQISAMFGQVGQLVSVLPLPIVISLFGWTAGFMALVAGGVFTLLLCILTLQDTPAEGKAIKQMMRGELKEVLETTQISVVTGAIPIVAQPPMGKNARFGSILKKIGQSIKLPGVQLAFWVHFTAPFAGSMFASLWGFPFLTRGMGLTDSTAYSMLVVSIVSGLFTGLIVGPIVTKFMRYRVHIVVGVILLTLTVWSLVIFLPGRAPLWLIVTLVVIGALGGPLSLVGFDIARTHVSPTRLSTATGFVNIGGYISTLLLIALIGLLLDLQGANTPELQNYDAFRLAFSSQYLFWILGLVMIAITYPKALRDFRKLKA